MKFGRKDIVIGVLFAIVIAIFINYTSIERIIEMNGSYNESLLNTLKFSLVWHIAVSLLFYIYYITIFNIFNKQSNNALILIPIFIGAVIFAYILSDIQPFLRDFHMPGSLGGGGGGSNANEAAREAANAVSNSVRPPRNPPQYKGFNASLFKNMLVVMLNLLFVYIQRLLYTNQAIARRNEQLQLETIKSQHNALLQQINPHFFFNSLNSLRYIILKSETDSALEYLDNLTAIFRKTLKASDSKLHTLSEEMELAHSYTHIVERRFEGKLSILFRVDDRYDSYMIAPLSILSLIENVVKHNKISSRSPIKVSIYTTDDASVVVENNIEHKFEEVEKSGIGLKNLNQQYELLTANRGIEITNDESTFRVVLPLIKV